MYVQVLKKVKNMVAEGGQPSGRQQALKWDGACEFVCKGLRGEKANGV